MQAQEITTRYETTGLKKIVKVGLMLLYVLPPVGIAILALVGLYEIMETIRLKRTLPLNAATLFFTVIILSSFGAALTLERLEFLIYAVLFIAYFGLYKFFYDQMKPNDFLTFRRIAIAGGVYIVVFGTLYMFIHKLFGQLPWMIEVLTGAQLLGFDEYSRLYGSAYNPNFASYLLLFALGFCFMEILSFYRKKHHGATAIAVSIAIILGAGIIATGSRTGFATMVILVFIFLVKTNWRLAFIPISLFLLFPESFYLIIPRHEQIWHALQVRFDIWKTSIDIWMAHPRFGVTPGGFEQLYLQKTGEHIAHAHNVFLAFLAEYGTLAGFAFVLMVAATAKTMIKFMLRLKNKRWMDAFLFTLPVAVLTGVFDHPLFSPQLAIPTIMLYGVWDQYAERCHAVVKSRTILPWKKQQQTKKAIS